MSNRPIINELNNAINERRNTLKVPKDISTIQKELFGEGRMFGTNSDINTFNTNIISVQNLIDTKNDNLFNTVFERLKGININIIISFRTVLQTHLNIITKLQRNMNTIEGINNTRKMKILSEIKNLYKKYLDYIQKVVIVKVWKDLKILELFQFVFTIIIPGIIENIKKFETKTITLNTELTNKLTNITNKNDDRIQNYINLIKIKINKCLEDILKKIGTFLGDNNLPINQSGGANETSKVAKSEVEYATFTSSKELEDHIDNLRIHKENFEKALENNINQFDDLCKLFIELLHDIDFDIEEVIENITPYINITGLNKDADNLLKENKKLIDSLGEMVKKHPKYKDKRSSLRKAMNEYQPSQRKAQYLAQLQNIQNVGEQQALQQKAAQPPAAIKMSINSTSESAFNKPSSAASNTKP